MATDTMTAALPAPPAEAISAAVAAGTRSPCVKSKRGAAVFDGSAVIAVGFNGQPAPFSCDGSEICRSVCGKLCLHAEQRAIRQALVRVAVQRGIGPTLSGDGVSLAGLELVHAKVAGGKLVAGGGPSCWQCSRLVLEERLDAVWLFQQVWETCASDGDCRYCSGDACAECETAAACGNQLDACSASHDRHFGLRPVAPRWVRYPSATFHARTIASTVT